MVDEDFYEDDEPIEHIKAIKQRPYDFVTAPPPAPRAVTIFVPTAGDRWLSVFAISASEAACH